jgi:V-type H+-transporting ATPase subunit C
MNLSDELGKTDSVIEGIVRKIEKTAGDLGDRKGGHHIDLTVGGVPAPHYIQQFAWDSAKYPNRRPLRELVALIAGGATALEEELKKLTQSFGDKAMALQDVKRRKAGNLMSDDLNDLLNEDIMRKVQVVDSEYLKTMFIAVSKNLVENFEAGAYTLSALLL